MEDGAGGDMGATEMSFYRSVMQANTHDFEAKNTQGKNRAMQRHGQVLPPCRCIAGIASGEYICRRFLRGGGGGGNRQNWPGSAPRTTGYLFNFPATSVPSTFLRALRRLMSGVEFLSVPGLRATSQNILWSTTKVNDACVRPQHVA